MIRSSRLRRRISQGTRTEQGSRAFAVLASVIDTCRKRGVSLWPYLAEACPRPRCRKPPSSRPKASRR
ncbi:hypothetical protein CKO23_20820 [Thiocystis violacea]|nr:hypothetical protein [Thiocystis violacea]